jgi:hypothetical protein
MLYPTNVDVNTIEPALRFNSRRGPTTTRAPSSANSRAAACLIPELARVMMTTLPASTCIGSDSSRHGAAERLYRQET